MIAKLFSLIVAHWEWACLAAVFFVIIIHKKNEGTTKLFDVQADTDRDGMAKRVKKSMERMGGGDGDMKKRRKGAIVENDDFYADITVKGKKK